MQFRALVKRSYYQKAQQERLRTIAGGVYDACNGKIAYENVQSAITKIAPALAEYGRLLDLGLRKGSALTVEKAQARAALLKVLDEVSDLLDANANGNPLYILQAAMEARKLPVRHEDPPAIPQECIAKSNAITGQAVITYELLDYEIVSRVMMMWSTDQVIWNVGKFGSAGGKKGRILETGLPSGMVYFKLCSLNYHNVPGQWTEVFNGKVL